MKLIEVHGALPERDGCFIVPIVAKRVFLETIPASNAPQDERERSAAAATAQCPMPARLFPPARIQCAEPAVRPFLQRRRPRRAATRRDIRSLPEWRPIWEGAAARGSPLLSTEECGPVDDPVEPSSP